MIGKTPKYTSESKQIIVNLYHSGNTFPNQSGIRNITQCLARSITLLGFLLLCSNYQLSFTAEGYFATNIIKVVRIIRNPKL